MGKGRGAGGRGGGGEFGGLALAARQQASASAAPPGHIFTGSTILDESLSRGLGFKFSFSG